MTAPAREIVMRLLAAGYGVELAALGADLIAFSLGDLDLDSLSLMSFLAEVECEFRLTLEELRSIARRDCSIGQLFDLCHMAIARLT